jgi:glycosyltransferase involved in cell wall biosynthesis
VVTDEKYKAMVMRSCDLLFYPSYADPAPNVVLEAMACGLPIIYQPYGGVHEMVKGAGIRITHVGGSDYEKMIDIAVKGRDFYSNIARGNAEKVFSLENMIINYRDVFQMALELK